MSSTQLYNNIFSSNKESLLSGNISVDDYLITNKQDNRLGISLIISINSIKSQYEKLITFLNNLEPDQYYYPFSDLHITIFDYIKGNPSYTQNNELETVFNELTLKALHEQTAFNIKFKGVTFSNEAGLLQGYDNNILVLIRQKIRQLMDYYGVKNDERYKSESAHVTFCRFKSPLKNPDKLVSLIAGNRDYYIGNEEVTEIQLVEHDWYNKQEKRRIINTYKLSR